MNISNFVREKINQLESGSLLTYRDLDAPPEAIPSVIKALSALYRQGKLQRLAKGLYFKPEISEFGALLPSTSALLKKLLTEQKDKVSYLTGINTYNALRLTSQLSTEYLLATDRPRSPIRAGGTTIRFVLARLREAPSSPRLAQLLDALSEIKTLPDTDPTRAALVLLDHLRELPALQRQELVALACVYPPSTRALLGLLLEQLNERSLAQKLRKTLNPISQFRLRLDLSRFPTTLGWNIA